MLGIETRKTVRCFASSPSLAAFLRHGEPRCQLAEGSACSRREARAWSARSSHGSRPVRLGIAPRFSWDTCTTWHLTQDTTTNRYGQVGSRSGSKAQGWWKKWRRTCVERGRRDADDGGRADCGRKLRETEPSFGSGKRPSIQTAARRARSARRNGSPRVRQGEPATQAGCVPLRFETGWQLPADERIVHGLPGYVPGHNQDGRFSCAHRAVDCLDGGGYGSSVPLPSRPRPTTSLPYVRIPYKIGRFR